MPVLRNSPKPPPRNIFQGSRILRAASGGGGGGGSFSFVGATTSASGNGVTSLTVNVPAGVADGDFLVLAAVSYLGSGSWNVPSGWTSLYNQALPASSNHKFLLAWRVASSEPSSYALTSTASGWPSVIMYAIRGGAASSPVLGSALATSSSYQTTLPVPSYTESQSSSLLIYGYGGVNSAASGGGGLTITGPGNLLSGSMTADVNNTSGGTDLLMLACTSAASPGSASITTGDNECDFVIELASGSGATGVSGSDAGHAAEAGSVTGKPPGADSGHAAESGSIQAAVSKADTGHAAEAGSVHAALHGADTGHAAEAAYGFGGDWGHAAEGASVGLSRGDTGHAAESGTVHAALATGDSGHAAESGSVHAAVSKADTGHAAEAGSTSGGSVAKSSADTAKATESAFYYFPNADTGHAAEGSRMAVAGADSASAADVPLRSWPRSADAASAADAPLNSRPRSADTGHAAEAVLPFPVPATSSAADTAHAADAVHEIGIWTYIPVGIRLLLPPPYRHDPVHAERVRAAVARLAASGGWRTVRVAEEADTAETLGERPEPGI